MEPLSLANALFSKVQHRVLALIFGQPERSFYTSEIMRHVRSGSGAVARELSRLQRSGLVSVKRIGNQTHYSANRASPVFKELRNLVTKTAGWAEPIRAALEPYADKIEMAFIFGSVAKGTDSAGSDIDLMVIGDGLSYSGLYSALQDAEDVLARKVSPMFLSPEEWRRKAADENSVVGLIARAPKIFVVGAEKDSGHAQAGTGQSRHHRAAEG